MAQSRLAMILFGIYLILYVGFVGLNAFRPDWMEATPWLGINGAVLYGFALIVAAIGMALVYGWASAWMDQNDRRTAEQKRDQG